MADQLQNNLKEWFDRHGLSSRATSRRAQLDVAHANDRVLCIEGDLAMPSIPFQSELPEQYFQMGISEQNIVGVATGLAMRGNIPFVNSFATFLAARACEQVRLDVAYQGSNVKLVGSYCGISGGAAGPTHHSCEDIAVMRTMPNMVILSPADAFETYKAIRAAAEHAGPVYIRVGRAETPQVYHDDYDFVIGKAVQLAEGRDVTIIATGNQMVWEAVQAASQLRAEGIACRILNMHTIKPLDEAAILAAARETGAIVTVEEHNVLGGLGCATAEVVMCGAPVPVVRVGTLDRFCETTGPYEEMVAAYGLDAAAVKAAVRRALDLKRAAQLVVR